MDGSGLGRRSVDSDSDTVGVGDAHDRISTDAGRDAGDLRGSSVRADG